MIDLWIITAGELFDSIIIKDEIPITDMPSVHQTTLSAEVEDASRKYIDDIKSNTIDAAMKELGEEAIINCHIPSKADLMNASKEFPIVWNAVTSYNQGSTQPISSYQEQKLAIELCTSAIDSYAKISSIFTKKCRHSWFSW